MNDKDAARRKAFGKMMEARRNIFRRCLAPIDACDGEPIRAHSVQNAVMLDALQHDGHVIVPKLDLSLAHGARVEFALIGRGHATTFHGLCGNHDRELFSPIEREPLDLRSAEHLFLLAYRAVLKESHATAKSAIDTQAGYNAGVEEGLFPDAPCAPGELAVEHMMLAYETYRHKLRYDEAYAANRWDVLEHSVIDLNVGACVAVNAMLSCGRYSVETDSLAYATLNVFPLEGSTFLVFSYLAEHRRHFNRSFGRFLSSGDLREKLSYLILKRCENFVISPIVFAEMTEDQKAECVRFFERNVGPNEYEPHRPDLIYLFGGR